MNTTLPCKNNRRIVVTNYNQQGANIKKYHSISKSTEDIFVKPSVSLSSLVISGSRTTYISACILLKAIDKCS